MRTFSKIIIVVAFFSLLTLGCTNKGLGIDGKQLEKEVEKVKIELVNKTKSSKGIEHTLKASNGSSFTIKEYSLSLSYLIKNGTNGHKTNINKVVATGLPKNISSGGETTFKVFVPNQYYDGKNLDLERVYVDIKGYFNKVSKANAFGISGDIESLNFLGK